MKSETKNLDEVVFEKRNQNYGAFFLRRSYNKNVTRALFFAVFIFLGLISIPLIASYMNRFVKVSVDTTITFDGGMKPPVKNDIEDVKPQEEKKVERMVYTAPVITTDPDDKADDFADLQENTNNGVVSIDSDTNLTFVDKHNESPIEPVITEKPWLSVDIMPTFKGGEDAMFKFLSDHIVYPQMAKETNISGTVGVTFVVEKDGSITNIALLNDIGGSCGEEAMRVVKMMPRWNGGRQNNIPVRVQFVLPVKFVLEAQ